MNQVILLSTEKMSDLDYQPKINRSIRFLSKRNHYDGDDRDYRIDTCHTYSLSTVEVLTSTGWWVSKGCVLELRYKEVL